MLLSIQIGKRLRAAALQVEVDSMGSHKTRVMSASLRGVNKVKSLAGIDALIMPPTLLEELRNSTDAIPKKLDAAAAKQEEAIRKLSYIDDEHEFGRALLKDRCAFDNLHEGIRKFSEDVNSLGKFLREGEDTAYYY